MEFKSGYKDKVIESINTAIRKVNLVQSTAKGITIPADFERAEELKSNVITAIENINLNDLKNEILDAIGAYENVETMNQDLASNFGMSPYVYPTVKSVEVFLLKKEINNYITQDSFYYKDLDNTKDFPNGVMKNCMTYETKKELQKMINAIDSTTIKNTGTDIETFKKNIKYAIANSNRYVYGQERDLNELNIKKTDKDIKLEEDNIKEYMNDVIKASTHVKDDGYLYTYKDGKEERLTREEWLNIVSQTAEEINNNSSSKGGHNYYGNSGTPEAGQVQNAKTNGNIGNAKEYKVDYASYVACDRLISMSINNAGLYDDQNLGGQNICREKYLTEHGFEKVEDLTDIKPGDIIEISGQFTHYFVINEYDEATGLCTKFDMGSNERINTKQPNDEVLVVEEKWIEMDPSRELYAIYRLKE